ncbi:MAG: DnaA regulatory inactivator Hda [Geobacter sp.]|nr:DnaA regulatory inactivator Hda [Geobacter sp.]
MQLVFDFPIKPEYSFDNFVTCSGNQTALVFAQRVVTGNTGENLLYLHGDDGAGKTHLLTAMGRELDAPVIPVEQLSAGGCADVFAGLRQLPALLLDDLQLLADDNDLRVALWQLFNDFYSSGRKIAAAATLPPKELETLDPHLKSRFLWGLVAKLDISDDESRRMILQKLADDRQIILPEDVCSYLLVHLPRAIPSLSAAIDRIKHHSFATQRKISLKLAREVLAG